MSMQPTDQIIVEREGALYRAPISRLPTGETQGEINPVITYTNGIVTRIDFDSGNYKLFTYTNGLLTRVDYHKGAQVLRKDLVYVDGRLSQIIDTVV